MICRHNYYYYYYSSSWAVSELKYSPEGLALHVLLCQSMVGESLVPHGVAGISQGFCAQFSGLSDLT